LIGRTEGTSVSFSKERKTEWIADRKKLPVAEKPTGEKRGRGAEGVNARERGEWTHISKERKIIGLSALDSVQCPGAFTRSMGEVYLVSLEKQGGEGRSPSGRKLGKKQFLSPRLYFRATPMS